MRARAAGGWFTATLVATAVASLLWAPSSSARPSVTPASWTPAVTSPNATVRQLVQCGSTMFAVGSFSTITQGGHTYTRRNAFSFNANTGAVTTWNPNVNGVVNSIALTPNCRRAFLGGSFTFLRGRTVQDLAAVSTLSSAVIMKFGHKTDGEVDTLALVNRGRDLMVGGSFTIINGVGKRYLAAIGPRFGVVSHYFTLSISGRLPGHAGKTMVYNEQRSPKGDRLLFEGDFTKVGSHHREQAVELNLGRSKATLNGWGNATLASKHCLKDEEFYARSGAFSPDESTIYLAAIGFNGSSPYCDAVTAFTNTRAATALWINKTGGDSLHSVAASATGVYIGGHQRWADNPEGHDNCGPGCVERPGIGEISAQSGLATSWNPTHSRGHGADGLLITSRGLWIASDTFFDAVDCGGSYHPGICFFHGTA